MHTGNAYRLTDMLPSAPDMSQLKLGVRSVAGKLSVMASGVVNTIQVGEGTRRLKSDPKIVMSDKLLLLFFFLSRIITALESQRVSSWINRSYS